MSEAPDLPAPTLLAYLEYASSGLSLGISGTSDARGPLLQWCLIV